MLYTLLLHKQPILSSHFSAQMAKISPLDYSSLYSIAHKSKAPKCTMYTWAVMQMWSHTPAPRHTQTDTNTDGHTPLWMQQDAKKNHTQGFGVLVSILSLFLRLSQGSCCGHMTHCCCCCCFMHVEMHLCSCEYCIYDSCMTVSVCLFLYVLPSFSWI